MKMVICIIRSEKLDAVADALNKQHVIGMTITDVRGFGRQKGKDDSQRAIGDSSIHFVSKIRVDVVVQDEDVSKVMRTVADVARTGQAGDGKIFVTDVSHAVRIRTGDKGSSAL